ncbi:hypothetical protein Bpfe_016055, partial [Biomphalaria pfeifferi]
MGALKIDNNKGSGTSSFAPTAANYGSVPASLSSALAPARPNGKDCTFNNA